MNAMMFIRMAQALNPLQSVRITFVRGIDGIRILSVLDSLGVVEDKSLARIVLGTQGWPNVPRVMTVRLNRLLLNVDGLPALAERGIENINVVSESPLNALQTGREKKRQEAYIEIVNAVATKELHSEINGYGLSLQVEGVKEMNFFNNIRFAIRTGNETEEILSLDGWSGNILDGHRKAIFFCATLDTARVQLKQAFEQYLERATAFA